MDALRVKNYFIRHRLISAVRDINVRGIRKIAAFLPKVLIPKATGPFILETIHGISLRIDPTIDNGVERSLHETGTYEKGVLGFMEDYLQPGDIFVDIGANIGLMSIFASKCVGDTGHVHAFEALPKTALILEENMRINAVKNCTMHGFALGAAKGTATIYENMQVNRGGASLVVSDGSQGTQISLEKLDDVYPNTAPIAMVKIDVEGYEPMVLEGAKHTLFRCRPIVIIEVSSAVSESSIDALNQIRALGAYRFYRLKGTKERRSILLEIKEEDALPAHDNVFCIPSERSKQLAK
jgi:FkbM family methyltransferase